MFANLAYQLPWTLADFFTTSFQALSAIDGPLETTLEDAMECVHPGDRIYLTGNDGELELIHRALHDRALNFDSPARVLQLLSRSTTLCGEDMLGKISCVTPFPGSGTRNGHQTINNHGVDVIEAHLSEINDLLRNEFKPNIAVVHTSAPVGGRLHLAEGGIAIHAVNAVKENGGIIIAVANKQYPFLSGHCFIQLKDVDYLVHVNVPPMTHSHAATEPHQEALSHQLATMLQDGNVIQSGIGPTQAAVLQAIESKGLKDISIFAEVLMITRQLRALIEAGVINGHGLNDGHFGCAVCGILLAESQEDYEWLRRNGIKIHVEPQAYVNNADTIIKVCKPGHQFVSVNAALQATISGEVAAHSYACPPRTFAVHHEVHQHSCFGGALDFCRAAAKAGGLSIIMLPSARNLKGDCVSNICAVFPEGTRVTYTAADTMYIVTDQGIAHIRHQSASGRLHAVMQLARPQHRDSIARAVKKQIPALAGEVDRYLEQPYTR